MSTFVRKISEGRSPVYEVVGRDADGGMNAFLLQLDAGKEQSFVQAMENPPLDVTQFGIVHYAGAGETVPKDVIAEVMEELGQ